MSPREAVGWADQLGCAVEDVPAVLTRQARTLEALRVEVVRAQDQMVGVPDREVAGSLHRAACSLGVAVVRVHDAAVSARRTA